MSQLITVREYARLTTATLLETSLDQAQISQSAFDYLCELNASFTRGGATLVQVDGRRALRLDNHVGMIETPCGTCIEILPKHTRNDDCLLAARGLLRRLIQNALQLPTRSAEAASLERFDEPLSEWIMRQFLEALETLSKRGLRFDYRREEEEQRFLRGQLNVTAQLRQPPGRQHHFQIRHNIYTADRAENRLLMAALARVCAATRDAENWRRAHELRIRLQEIPASRDVAADLRQWRTDRLMAHYQEIRLWCELVLGDRTPLAVAGEWRGVSLLFPMERLFEQYVEMQLGRQLDFQAHLTPQTSRHSFCTYQQKPYLQLKPDLLVEHHDDAWVVDAKWKLLDGIGRDYPQNLSRDDFYQMFAYGQHYLRGEGQLLLVYPAHADFPKALAEPFQLPGGKQLWVLALDLDTGELSGTARTSLPLRQQTRLQAIFRNGGVPS